MEASNQPKEQIEKPKEKTPYQGKHRTFGLFYCSLCKKSWNSANTWANKGQKCNQCHEMVYPHRQWPLKRRKTPVKNKKNHPVDLCEKCKELGHTCVRLRVGYKKLGK